MGLLAEADLRVRRIAFAVGRLPPALIPWLAAASLTAIFAIFGYVLYATRFDAKHAAWVASSNLVSALSHEVGREIDLLDMSLLDLRDSAAEPAIMALPTKLRDTVLFDRAASAHGLGSLLLLDAQGRVVAQSGIENPQPIDLSQESFFRVHLTTDKGGLFVSHPFVSLVDGEGSIALSRRIEREGVFQGVAVATIKLSHIKEMFGRVTLDRSDSIALADLDGTILMRQPFAQVPSDKPPLLVEHKQEMNQTGAGTFEGVSRIDHVRRQYFYNRVGDTPLVEVLGRSISGIYAAWWMRSALTAVAMLLLGNAILLLIAVSQVELRRRTAAETALAVLATTDKLTGLANRRRFDETLDAAWIRARSSRTGLALLLIDVDHFKALNDHVGHQGGDAVLAAVGDCLGRLPVGSGSLVARYGGEEFAILMENADAVLATETAERVRTAVSALAQPHPTSRSGRLTASVGVALLGPGSADNPAVLFAAADSALYQAKHSGRDRVALAECVALAA